MGIWNKMVHVASTRLKAYLPIPDLIRYTIVTGQILRELQAPEFLL